ncbi:uncharacterized protein [Montipora capricornis]|uniref:uncharacterized protein isoform X1 n=1 Tax=Montipora capricornis TaxID=246305 RepID=UPI0035F1BC64
MLTKTFYLLTCLLFLSMIESARGSSHLRIQGPAGLPAVNDGLQEKRENEGPKGSIGSSHLQVRRQLPLPPVPQTGKRESEGPKGSFVGAKDWIALPPGIKLQVVDKRHSTQQDQ